MEVEKKGFPEGWKVVRLGEVCDKIIGGGTPSTKNEEYWDGDIPWISSADIHGIKDVRPRKSINEKAIENSTTNLVPKGSIIVVTRVGLGKLAIAPFDLCFSQDNQGLVLKENLISADYALLVLHQEVQNFLHQSRGTTINGVTKKQLVELPLALPLLAEQQRIVAKIEELFSELDAAKGELEKAAQQLKVYRQAVLKWAFEGRLTNEVMDGELPDGWRRVKFGEVHEIKSNLVDPKDFGDSPHIAPDNIAKGTGQLLAYRTIKEDGVFSPKHRFYKGQIVYSKIRPNLAKVIIAPFDGLCSADMYPIESSLDNRFSYYFMLSKAFVNNAFNTESRTVLPKINQKGLNEIPFPLCSLEEQHRIVQEIESRLSVCDKIGATIAESLLQAEALRQSILKKAFEGKLVTQKRAKIVPFFPVIEEDNHLRKVFAAYIISRCYNDRHFGRVVFQKMLHLAEYHCQLDYETYYLKQAAGPLDKFIYRLIKEAEEKDWFTVRERGKQYRFEPGTRLPGLLQDYAAHFAPYNDCLEQVFRFLKGRNMDEAELFSTVYAVWNNCIIQGVAPDKPRMVREVHAWSDRKEKYNEAQIWDAKGLLERAGLAPHGTGRPIEKPSGVI